MSKSIEELTAEIDVIVSKLQVDLQISSPSKLFGNTLLPNMGFSAVAKSFPGLTRMINESIRQNQLLEEIAHTTGKTTDEIMEFYQSHPYSLEFIKNILMMGAELNEESINSKASIGKVSCDWIQLSDNVAYIDEGVVMNINKFKQESEGSLHGWMDLEKSLDYTFLVILPNNERREVKASYMEVDNGSLYFEDDNQETILAFAPGHWVWAERVKDE